MTKKYTIDNAKNDIQNLQSQNLFDFQEIKRLDSLIKDYEKRVLQAINFNNQINKKIQYDYENLKKTALDRIKYLEDKLSTDSGGSGLTQTDVENIVNELIRDLDGLDSLQVAKLETAYNHSQTAHLTINDVNNLLGNIGGTTVNTNINVVIPGFIGNETFYEFDEIGNEYMTESDNKTLHITSDEFIAMFYDCYLGTHSDGMTVSKQIIGYDETNTYPVYEFDFKPKNYNKVIMLSSGLHPYEFTASFGLAHVIKALMTKPETHYSFQYIRENVRIKIIPILNPWGFNQSPKQYPNVNGVNPNRNFDSDGSWENFTAKPNEWNKKGDAPFSEQETKNIANWCYYNKNDALFWIDCHTGNSDRNNDIWFMYNSCLPIKDKVLTAYEKIKTRFKSYYGVEPKTLVELDASTSLKPQFVIKAMGIPCFVPEQSAIGRVYSTGEYENNGGAIREYACQLYAFIQECLTCESESIPLLEYINRIFHRTVDNACKQLHYYPNTKVLPFINGCQLDYNFMGKGVIPQSPLKVNYGTISSSDGSYTYNSLRLFTDYIEVKNNKASFTKNTSHFNIILRCYNSSYNYLGVGNPSGFISSGEVTLKTNTKYIVLVLKYSLDTIPLISDNFSDRIIRINDVDYVIQYDNNLSYNHNETPIPQKTYSVTYNLNGVTSSNNTTSITENGKYNTTLTPNNNLTINSVSVTVGGVDVTTNVYSNGTINIDNVNGNIVITASVINEDSNSIIKCKNAGLTASYGTETESTTRISTDFIPVTISDNSLSILSKTTEKYSYLVRYYGINKNFLGNGGSEWSSDGSTVSFLAPNNVNFVKVKFLRLVYKSNISDDEVINTISGTIEIEGDGNVRSLCME